ncbi:MAG: hypothetical protein JJU33_06695 [Phycisphaerales bacterium]|nr:hypothetical protein [Phycisphaerales bacterium]
MTAKAASLVLGLFAITSAGLSFATIADCGAAAEPAAEAREREQAAAPEFEFVSDSRIQVGGDRLFARVALVRNNLIEYGGLLVLDESPSFHAPIGFPSHLMDAKALSPDGEVIAHTYPLDSSPISIRSISQHPGSIIEFEPIREHEIENDFGDFVMPVDMSYSPDGETIVLVDMSRHFKDTLPLQIVFLDPDTGDMTRIPMSWAAFGPVLWESDDTFFVHCIADLVDGSLEYADYNRGFGRISRQDGDWTVERVQDFGILIGLHTPSRRPIWFTGNTVVIGDGFELFDAGDLVDREEPSPLAWAYRRFRVAAIDTERLALLIDETRLVVVEIDTARILLDREIDNSIVLLAQQERPDGGTAAVLGRGDRVAVADIDTLLAGPDRIDWRKVEVFTWRTVNRER